jgi:tetratricopeptide (TPR) repeat protein
MTILKRTVTIAVVAMFLASPVLPLRLARDPIVVARSESPLAMEQRNASAFATILGEFRTNLSDMIFIKTERYLHSGVAYQPHLNTDEMARTGRVEHAKSHTHDHDHGDHSHDDHHHEPDSAESLTEEVGKGLATDVMKETAGLKPGEMFEEKPADVVATVIRTVGNDFRGFIGELERRVKPWRDPTLAHRHTAGTELLPWYRLATMSNPRNVRGYLIGAWWLKNQRTAEQLEEALKFIEEGIANNPRAFQLHLMRGNILRRMERHDEARAAYRAAADLGIAQRPPDGKEGPAWTSYNEDDITAAILLSVFSERDQNGREAALALARDYLARLQSFPPLDRVIRSLEKPPDATEPAQAPAPAVGP